MKYIILDAPGGEAAVLFPRRFMHRWMADQMRPMPVVAAGFVRLDGDRPRCHGESVGLKIAARPERDAAIVAAALAADNPRSEGSPASP